MVRREPGSREIPFFVGRLSQTGVELESLTPHRIVRPVILFDEVPVEAILGKYPKSAAPRAMELPSNDGTRA